MAAKRLSSDRIRMRSLLPAEKQETVQECPACDGKKTQPSKKPDRAVSLCWWCDGTGLVTTRLWRIYRRWVRTSKHYRDIGQCPLPRKIDLPLQRPA